MKTFTDLVDEFFKARTAEGVNRCFFELSKAGTQDLRALFTTLTLDRKLTNPHASIELRLGSSHVVCATNDIKNFGFGLLNCFIYSVVKGRFVEGYVFGNDSLEEVIATNEFSKWFVGRFGGQIPYRFEIAGEDYVVERRVQPVEFKDSDVVASLSKSLTGFKYLGIYKERFSSISVLNWRTGAHYEVKLSVYESRGKQPLCQMSVTYLGKYMDFPEASKFTTESIVHDILSMANSLEALRGSEGARYTRTKFTVRDWLEGKTPKRG